MTKNKRLGLLGIIGPGLIVAATGVGAGDLATGALTGIRLGVVVLWAVLVGALVKFVLNEGLARWQLATGQTVLEGVILRPGPRIGRIVQAVFLIYLLIWSCWVAAALMSACGITGHAMLPLTGSADGDKAVYGIAHSLLGVALVLAGGYKLLEKVMSVCIAVMFVTVVATAILVGPDWSQVAEGLVLPRIPLLDKDALAWTVALTGGVGGTLTVLCYGYWIRERGRRGPKMLKTCRIDLGVGYAFTAVFGIAMVIIGSTIAIEGKGAKLVVALADKLHSPLGAGGRWVFLIGAWCALFSSLLGVWQSVPYVFADFCNLVRRRRRADPAAAGTHVEVDTRSRPYRGYLFAIALVPMVGLFFSFKQVQKAYAIFGAMFMPLLAAALLVLNTRRRWVGEKMRNHPITNVFLVLTILLFLTAAMFLVRDFIQYLSQTGKTV